MDYWDATDYILALPDMERFSSERGGHTMTLEAMKALLCRLGNPESWRKTVHVTGSKGKGSTSTYLASILHCAGLPAALYNSPHLQEYTERLTFGMQTVSEELFAEGIDAISFDIDEINQSDLGPVSTFGALNALFFYLCRKLKMQWQVVEVGLGGRDDATNVFDDKELVIITPISLEHTSILGNSCAEIAESKAGIITQGCTTVLAPQKDPSVREVISARCSDLTSTLIDVEQLYQTKSLSFSPSGQSFSISGPGGALNLHTRMLGLHQQDNAATAIAAAQALVERGAVITPEAIADGIEAVKVPGRLEQLSADPVIVVDGAHNGESAAALADALRRHFQFRRCVIILGVNVDKKIDQILEKLQPLQPLIIATRSQSLKAMKTEKIVEAASRFSLETRMANSLPAAVDLSNKLADPGDLICITGSLYLVGEARERLGQQPVSAHALQ